MIRKTVREAEITVTTETTALTGETMTEADQSTIISMREGTFGYDSNKPIFKDISLDIRLGTVTCLLGPNGAGKSTLLACLRGLERLQSGRVCVAGTDINGWSQRELAQRIGFVPQHHVPTFPYLVEDVVLMGRTAYHSMVADDTEEDRLIVTSVLQELNLLELRYKPYTEISGGERQLVLLAAALAQEPEVLILDEPTSSLDFGNQHRLLQLLKRLAAQGIGIVICTHVPDHALLVADEVIMLKDGCLKYRGRPADIITEDTIRELYGIEAELVDFGPERGRRIICDL